jgi:hypothetical protein
VVVHHDRRADRQRRDSEDRADHPLRASEPGIKSKLRAVRICDALKCAENKLGLQRNRRQGRLSLGGGENALEARRLSDHLRDLCERGGGAGRTERGMTIILPVPLEASRSRNILGSRVSGEALGAGETDEVAELLGSLKELVEIDRPSDRNVSKVSRAELVRLLARGADLAIFNDSEPCVKDPVGDRLVALIGLVCRDLHDGPLADVLGIGNAELNADDSIPHG